MALDDIRSQRLGKLTLLEQRGIDPYPAECNRTDDNTSFLQNFATFEQNQLPITLAGRVMSVRTQGGISFADIFDGTERVQVLLKKDEIGEAAFDLFHEMVGVSDFIEASGVAFTTKRGMRSLRVVSWRLLAKSLNPVPDEWFGLKDDEGRFRKRFLDMILNPEVADIARKRSVFWNAVRTFMLDRGFIEVETPILETKTGGAEARPFITHYNALDMEVFLRISPELWHKKLIIGGLPRVFEIGRVFRNEGISPEHAQDYTHFEFYEAYGDHRKGVPMLIDLYRFVAEKTFGTTQFIVNGFSVDLGSEWRAYDFNELMLQQYQFDPRTVDLPTVLQELTAHNISHDEHIDIGRGVDMLWKKVRKTIGGPGILTGIPVYLEPLAKKTHGNPGTVDRFQILLGGSEVGKAFNELNDPIDQLARFQKQQALRDAGDDEAQMADYDYVEAMEYGMPPTFGFGVSERLFSFLLGKSIRESQLFPVMKPKA